VGVICARDLLGYQPRRLVVPQDTPLPEKVAESFRKLKVVAADLNKASGDLVKPIAALDEKLQRLNLGISTWVTMHGGDSEDGENYWFVELGYAKVGPTWGIAIRERSGSHIEPSEARETWLFANAPRVHRVDAVDELASLLEKLIAAAAETTQKLREKIAAAQQVAEAFGEPRVTAEAQARALSGATAGDAAAALLKGLRK
jgi:hypothetical protein